MSFARIGMDMMGGGMQGASAGAGISAALTAAGYSNPYTGVLMAGMAGVGALQRVMAGAADAPAEEMQLRLGKQQITMNSLDIAAKQRAMNDEARARRKTRMFQDAISGIFGRYQKGAG